MKAKLYYSVIAFFIISQAFGQQQSQTLRGTVLDADSKIPLVGVQVIILNTDPIVGTTTDIKGEFVLRSVVVGRTSLKISYVGYETITIPDIQVISGKETIVNTFLQESVIELQEVLVKAINAGEPVDEMAIISTRSISSEETTRYAGGFNDPARILSNFAGVNNSQDGSADIIVRGNSPKYLQWRLEGVEISSPNHFADPSGLGTNGISALNNNILATSDFYTGAFPAEFGDALSGVYDVKLRKGNNEKYESIAGVGILGTDVTLEGPFRKDYRGSFLMNYRFTTIGLVSKLGLLDNIGGIPSFQDGAFNFVLPTAKVGTFSIFGLLGSSSIAFKDVNPGIWLTPNDRGRQDDITEDYRKDSHLINTGINHIYYVTRDGYLNTTLAFSKEGINDNVFEALKQNGQLIHARDNFNSKLTNSSYRINLTYNQKLNPRNTLQVGSKYALMNQRFDARKVIDDIGTWQPLANFNEEIKTWRNFINWKHRLNNQVSIVAGVHNMNVLLNNKSTFEPRMAARWQVNNNHALSLGYGMHSTMESIHNYFAKVTMPDGTVVEPNRDLDLLKAHHVVLGYETSIKRQIRTKVELYYQDLYNLPVENDPVSSYSTINENLSIRYVDLVNKGTGENYGIEFTLEKTFSKGYYYLINSSVFQSTYRALDGVKRNTSFNSNYLINFLFGKEFTRWGSKKNQTFAVNTKIFAGGGRRIIPLLRDNEGNLAVDPDNNRYYDDTRAYENYLDDIYTITLSLSYKWDKRKSTHELFLNIDNLTNNKPRLSEYYDSEKPNSIGYLTPIGAFPNLMYRVYF